MNPYHFLLKALRKCYAKAFGLKLPQRPYLESSKEVTSQNIFKLLTSPEPCMIARFGSVELNAVNNYLGVAKSSRSPLIFIRGAAVVVERKGSQRA